MSETSVETVAPPPNAAASQGAIDLRQLGQDLHRLLVESATEDHATASLIRLALKLTRSRAIVYFNEDSTGELSALPCNQCPDAIAESTLNKLYALARMARQTKTVQIARTEQSDNGVALAAPVLRPNMGAEVLVVIADAGDDLQRRLAGLVQVTQFVGAFAGQWRGRFEEIQSCRERAQLDRFCLAMLAAERAENFTAATNRLADGISEMLQASLVGVGLRRSGGLVKLIGISNQLQFDRSSELAKRLESVMAEALLTDGQAANGSAGRTTEAVRDLRTMLNVESVYHSPLKDGQGKVIGAFVVAREQPLTTNDQDSTRLAQQLLGHEIDLMRRARRGVIARQISRLRSLSKTGKQVVGACSVLLLLGLFALPVPHRISCDCEIQPITRRFVAAPYEGRLESALVEPGDLVKKGQTLARMDAREIRLERASVEADLVRAVKQRDTSMAGRDTAATQLAEFEMERLNLKLQMLQDRMDNLEIKSPTDGIVISGDPKKLEGSRLTIGQTLVEVGPLGQTLLEVAVPDEDIAYVQTGQPVEFRLESLPYSEFEGVLGKIHPRSEQLDSENVFVADVRINDNPDILRPGMRGRARIEAKKRSLFWVLFHRAWEQVLFRMGW